MPIYEPKGRAREYSPLALNYYSGCDHGCKYCYVPGMMKKFRDYYHSSVTIQKDAIKKLRKQTPKFKKCKQVLLSFTGDPYCNANIELDITRQVLEILLENEIPVSVLTKGGTSCLRDIELFKKFKGNIQIGATLTFNNNYDSLKWEPGATNPANRLAALSHLHRHGIKTWASFEPVIDIKQSLNMIAKSWGFIDKYKIGKLNHNKELESNINWGSFLNDAVSLLRRYNRPFYIKSDLAKFAKPGFLKAHEIDMGYLNLEWG